MIITEGKSGILKERYVNVGVVSIIQTFCASSVRDFRFSTASLLGDTNVGPLT